MDGHVKLPKRDEGSGEAGPRVASVEVRPGACRVPTRIDKILVPCMKDLFSLNTFTKAR